MNSSEKIDQIYPALAAAQGEFPGVEKSGKNAFDNYSYGKLSDYIFAAQPVLAKHGLFVVSILDGIERLPDRRTAKGATEYACEVKVTVRVCHSSGQWIEGTFTGCGQDRADKSVYKAMTGARKYGMASLLGLATTDDPENDSDTPKGNGGTGSRRSRADGGGRPDVQDYQEPPDDLYDEQVNAPQAGQASGATTDSIIERVETLKKVGAAISAWVPGDQKDKEVAAQRLVALKAFFNVGSKHDLAGLPTDKLEGGLKAVLSAIANRQAVLDAAAGVAKHDGGPSVEPGGGPETVTEKL